MSDSNIENTNSGNDKNGETSSSDNKPSLTSLTHKLKAEALRRFKIDGEVEDEGSSSTPDEDGKYRIKKENEQDLNEKLSQPDEQTQEETIVEGSKESASLSTSEPLNSLSVPTVDPDQSINNVANLTQSNIECEKENIISEQDIEAHKSPNESFKILDPTNDENMEPSDQHTLVSSNDKDTAVLESSIPKDNASPTYPSEDSGEDKYVSIEETRSDIMPSDVVNTITKIEDQTHENSEKNNHAFSQPSGDPLQGDTDIHRTSYNNGGEYIDHSSEIQISMPESSIAAVSNIDAAASNTDDSSGSKTVQITSTEADKVMQPLDQDMRIGGIKFEDNHSSTISDDKMPHPENGSESEQKMKKSIGQETEDVVATNRDSASSNELENDFKSSLNVTSNMEQNKDDGKNKGLEQNISSNIKNVDGGSFRGNSL